MRDPLGLNERLFAWYYRWGAEELPFEDQSLDTVVATFVLCTVADPRGALAEIARVLRPGGSFLFLEHVHAGEGTLLGRVQDLVELPHRYLAAGCCFSPVAAPRVGGLSVRRRRRQAGDGAAPASNHSAPPRRFRMRPRTAPPWRRASASG